MPENERVEPKPIDIGDYQFGFHDDVKPIASTGKGPTKEAVREISRINQNGCWTSVLNRWRYFIKCPCKNGVLT